MNRFLCTAAVLAVAIGALFAVQPAFAADRGCVGDALSGLASPAKLTPSQIAKKGGNTTGHVVMVIDEACKTFESPATAAAAAMKDAGYTPKEIGDVMISGFHLNVVESAGVFADLGFDATQIAKMLAGSYSQTALASAQ